jgi:hypothetical protein
MSSWSDRELGNGAVSYLPLIEASMVKDDYVYTIHK